MAYEKQTWSNLPNKTTPISAARLNHLETQYDEAVAASSSYTDEEVEALGGVYVPREMSEFQNVAVGKDALASAENLRVRNNNAFGIGALQHAVRARYNDAFGLNALHYLNSGVSEPDTTFKATRNSAFGSNTQRFNRIGYNNVTMGRNSLQCNETGIGNTAIGAGAIAGLAPIGLAGIIENQIPQNINRVTAVGSDTMRDALGDDNTCVGHSALKSIKEGVGNTAVGSQALSALGSSTLSGGGWKRSFSVSGVPYTTSGAHITVHTPPPSDLSTSSNIQFRIVGQELQTLPVESLTPGASFTVKAPIGTSEIPTSGNMDLVAYSTPGSRNNNYNTAIGFNALKNLDNRPSDPGTSASNTAVGLNALAVMEDGTHAVYLSNSAAVGANSRVSGNHQVQLGSSSTQPYAYAPLQVRSDARDKCDIRPTVLGLDFVSKLNPVDFRYDFRADYIRVDENGDVTHSPRDGSRSRSRLHHGLIAQDVQRLIQETGVDFGGFQDHSVNGGCDVLSIGYTELIAPMVKAIQELKQEVDALKSQVAPLQDDATPRPRPQEGSIHPTSN